MARPKADELIEIKIQPQAIPEKFNSPAELAKTIMPITAERIPTVTTAEIVLENDSSADLMISP